MTSRDPVAEWMRALAHKEQTVRRAPVAFARHVPAPSTIVFDRASADVSKTRVMSADETRRRFDWRDDLGDAIRMLQRHNKRLRAAFGIGWVEATHAVIGESQRRALPASMMARAVTAGLAREKGDA
jgi:hypothetical protein